MVTMNNRARLLVYGLAIVVGTFLGLLVAFNIVNNAFGEKGGNPVSLDAAVSTLMSKKVQAQLDNLSVSTNPCLKSVTAAPADGNSLAYSTYALSIDKNIYSVGSLNAVKFNGIYVFTSTYSNDGSCANRPDKSIAKSVKKVAYVGTYLFDTVTNQQVASDNGKESQALTKLAVSEISKATATKTAKYTKTFTADNKVFDTTQCCSRTYVPAIPVAAQEIDE